MSSNLLTNPKYWRDRAEEIRVLAERYIHPETKRMLANIVTVYEHLCGGRRNDCVNLIEAFLLRPNGARLASRLGNLTLVVDGTEIITFSSA